MKHTGYHRSGIPQAETKNLHMCPMKLSKFLLRLDGKQSSRANFKEGEERQTEEKRFVRPKGW